MPRSSVRFSDLGLKTQSVNRYISDSVVGNVSPSHLHNDEDLKRDRLIFVIILNLTNISCRLVYGKHICPSRHILFNTKESCVFFQSQKNWKIESFFVWWVQSWFDKIGLWLNTNVVSAILFLVLLKLWYTFNTWEVFDFIRVVLSESKIEKGLRSKYSVSRIITFSLSH